MSELPLGPAGGKGPDTFVPKPRFEYKAPSLFWEHRYLLAIFIIGLLAGWLYLIKAPYKQLKIDPPAPPPIYVEPIPERSASSAQ